jgi:hypothetical protein
MVIRIVLYRLTFADPSNREYVVEMAKGVDSFLERSDLAVPIRCIEFDCKGFIAVILELLDQFLRSCEVLVRDADVDASGRW